MVVMMSFLLFLLAPLSIRAEISVKDYVYWTKADISAWHQYFPSRYLQQELQTINRAMSVVTSLNMDINFSLTAMVTYQKQELETAQFTMEGTSAQGCVDGISSYMDKAINSAAETFRDCAADVDYAYLTRFYLSWMKTNSSYNNVYQRTLVGIDNCARTYPNRDSWSRLKFCVEAWTKNFFAVANSTTSDMSVSRAMGAFTGTVASCAQTAAKEVVAKGWKFLAMLVQCAKLSENVDAEIYEQELTSEFGKFITSNDLTTQIRYAASNNTRFVKDVEQQMVSYYDLQKRALEKYVIASRDQSFYYGQMTRYLGQYLNTIAATSLDNPGNVDCVSEANDALNNILNDGALNALQCDTLIVNDTKLRIARANDYFSQINNILPNTGNPAILFCFNEGYIFAEQTITNCYTLACNGFKIDISELNATIVDDVRVLQGYEQSFFSNSSLPCGDPILSRAFLEADRTLYNLQRCLYISSGTKYAVTTPDPFTTTTTTKPPSTWTPTTTTPPTPARTTLPPTTTSAYVTTTIGSARQG